MSLDLPEYYFRTRENGAAVFRVEFSNRSQRLDLRQIANVNTRNGEVRPHGQHELTQAELAAIESWMDERRQVLATRQIDDILRTVDHLNQTTHWAAQKAGDAELDAVTDALLLAMHDLRQVLVRKKSERLMQDAESATAED